MVHGTNVADRSADQSVDREQDLLAKRRDGTVTSLGAPPHASHTAFTI